MKRRNIRLATLAALFLALLPSTGLAFFTQTFKTTQALVAGNMVSLSTADSVVAATPNNLPSLYGVVTAITGSDTVEVANSEIEPVLVSTENGDIQPGNPITVSDVAGVGQRTDQTTRIVGYAQAFFNAKTPGAKSENVKNVNGKTVNAYFGQIAVLLGVGDYIAPPSSLAPGPKLPFQDFFNAIAGHQVLPSKVVLSLFLLLVVVVIVGVLIGVSVHSAITAIGRNPLASKRVIRGMIQVLIIVVVVMGGTMGAIYFIVSSK